MSKLTRLAALWVMAMWVGVASGETRHEIRFPDLPGHKTLKCDFHMHTVFSDGLVWPTVRVDEAWREGLDAIAITDHIEYQPHKQDLPASHNRAYELAEPLARQKNILLIRGAEITRDTPPGHFNAIFLTDVDPLDTKDFYQVFEHAAQQKAFVFWNHPYWQGPERGQWGQEQNTLLEKKQLQGIEVCNGPEYEPQAHRWAIEKNLIMVGNSDIHDPSCEENRTPERHRTLTLVFAKEKTLEALREALFTGRTAVWCGNRLIGREEYLRPMFAACVRVAPPHQRRETSVAVEIANHCELDINLERVGGGGPAKITLPAGTTSLTWLDVPADDAAEAPTYKVANFLVGPDEPMLTTLGVEP